MAARTPRRSFANPFVVTIAAIPACFVTTSSPPRQPPAQQTAQTEGPPLVAVGNPPRPQPTTQTQPDPAPAPRPPIMNPPRPQQPPQTPPDRPRPPGPPIGDPQRAQEPPPQPVRPPVVMNPPRPQPPVQQAGAWTVFKSKDGCMAAIKVECPKGEPGKPMPTCNPPPPMKYACPDGISLDSPITIVTTGDGCEIQREPMNCPPHTMCNPPRPRAVPCPKP